MSSSSPDAASPSTSSSDNSRQAAIPRMVWIVGIVMFCANVSSVIVYAYGGVYLREVLHFDLASVGKVEGYVEALSNLMKLVSGVLSDAFQRRKILILTGYGLIVGARYLLAAASFLPAAYIAARSLERIGNGVQAAPRSALVGDIAPHKRIGACYGLKRSLATLGSMIGAGVGIFIMAKTNNNYRALFAFTAIPVTVGFFLLVFKVREPQRLRQAAVLASVPSHAPKYRTTFKLENLKFLGTTYWKLMLVNFIFLLARMGESLLSVYGRELHIELKHIGWVMITFNTAWCCASYPLGRIADRMSRYWLLLLGMASLVFADVVLMSAHTVSVFFFGVFLWGVQYGVTMNVFISLINEVVPENLRGTGIGFYWVTCAVATYICDRVMTLIAKKYDTMRAAYEASGIVAVFALMSLIIIMGYKIRKPRS